MNSRLYCLWIRSLLCFSFITLLDQCYLFHYRGIAEVPEGTDATNSIEAVPVQDEVASEPSKLEGDSEYYIANYTYISQEPGDLTFNAGEVLTVLKKEGDWWTGKIKNNVGIFPSNYVQRVDVVSIFFMFDFFSVEFEN